LEALISLMGIGGKGPACALIDRRSAPKVNKTYKHT
jgi:hypothetical protein